MFVILRFLEITLFFQIAFCFKLSKPGGFMRIGFAITKIQAHVGNCRALNT
jgi:hypothetical protein